MNKLTRRNFLAAASATAVCVGIPPSALAEQKYKTTLHKALIRGLPNEASLTELKEAGFEGVECNAWSASPAAAEKARKAADNVGMRIHSVLRAWTNFNNPDGCDKDVASVKRALETAQILGADAILLVPCKMKGAAVPQPWEFDIELDPKTALVTKVVKGDNSKYESYIKAQNEATEMSRKALEQVIPTAENTGVIIGIENVWNNLWVKPDLMSAFIRSFQSKWIGTYFDIGNHVKYAPPEEWIRKLSDTICKCHVKDFLLSDDGKKGKFINIREGSVNWPKVRLALDEIGYNGWLTVEGSRGLSLEEKSKRLDLIIAGK